MRPLLILFTLVMLATGCGSEPAPKRPADSTPDETHEPTLEEAYEALDSFAETFITAANPDFDFQREKRREIYGCGGVEGVDWTRHRYSYIVATSTDDPERALTRAQEILAEIDVTASSIRQGHGYRFVTFRGPHFGGKVSAYSSGNVVLNGETTCVANPEG